MRKWLLLILSPVQEELHPDIFLSHLFLLFVCVCVHRCMWRSEGILWQVILFYHVGPGGPHSDRQACLVSGLLLSCVASPLTCSCSLTQGFALITAVAAKPGSWVCLPARPCTRKRTGCFAHSSQRHRPGTLYTRHLCVSTGKYV